MNRIYILAGCLLLAFTTMACKNQCKKACEHTADCLGTDDGECDDVKCSDADDTGAARDAAKCINDLSCDEITDPSGEALLECAQ